MEDYDKSNICFICNLEKYVFLKSSINFEHHVTRDHNMWSYVFFIYNLMQKPVVDMTGIESYVLSKIKTDDITWIPLRRALALEEEIDSENELKQKLTELKHRIRELSTLQL